MDTADENRGTPVVADARRQSDQGVLRTSMQNVTGQRDTKRRKTLSGALPKSSNVEEAEIQFPQPEEVVISPPRKTPSKHRISLGAAHAYYFKSTSKTPFQKDTSFQRLNESIDQHTGDVTANVAELSFLSLAGSTGSGSSVNDTLNQSVLSDTTELTASNFILASSSRQRLVEFSKLAAERKQNNEKNVTVTSEGNEPNGGTSVSQLPADTNKADSSDEAMNDAQNSEQAPKEVVGIAGSLSNVRKETIDVRRFSMGTASALRHVPSPVVVGRKSWHGTPGSVDVNSSVQRYKELAASMKQVRLARDQQRQDEIKTRQSMSNMSRMTDRSDLMSNTSFLSTPSESSSSGSRGDTTTDLSRKIDVSDLGSRTLDDLFEGLVPASASRSFSSATKEAIRAPDASTTDHNGHGVSHAFGYAVQNVPNATLHSASAQRALTPTKLSASSRRVANPMSIDSPARNTRSASKNDLNSSNMSQALMDSSTAADEVAVTRVFSPFKSASAQKALTPTKLSASPRRIVNPMSIDSPARNTRSASKNDMNTSAMSQASVNSSTTSSEETGASALSPFNSGSTQTALTPTKLSASPRRVANPMSIDSPARNTRSAANNLSKSPLSVPDISSKADSSPENFIQDEPHGLDDVTPARNNRTNALTKELHASIGSTKHQEYVLHSSLRKQGSVRKRGDAVRHVEFGSPEFVEFNKSSPSMNLTPMPANKLRVTDALQEDTVEIEADMNALLNGVPPQSGFYMSAPSIGMKVDSAKNAQEPDCDMSLDSLSESKEQETVQLEMNMDELLHDRCLENEYLKKDKRHDVASPSGKESKHGNTENSDDMNDSGMDESDVSRQNTVSLEANMSELLKFIGFTDGDTPADEKSHDLSRSRDHGISKGVPDDSRMQLEEENTVELEMNMSALLMATEFDLETSMNVSPKTARNRRRRSSISSRRFSLVPESRLSLSTDGHIVDSEGDEKVALSLAEQEKSTPSSIETPLTRKDVFCALSLDKTPSSSDFLKEVTGLLRDAEYGVTLNAVYSQVVDHIEETTDPPLDDHMKLVSGDLQRALTSGKKNKYEMLAQSVQANELKRWTSWLISVADTLAVPLKDLYVELSQKIHVIDKNCSWIEESLHLLSSLEQRAALRARKRSFSQRKVSKRMLQRLNT
jgi:hypothetical protein